MVFFLLFTLSTGFVLVVVAEVVLIQFSHQVFLFAKLLLHITYYDKILTEATLRQICCNHIWINALHPDTKRNQRDIGSGQKKHIAFCFSWSVILFRSEPFLGGTLNRDYSEILHRWQSSFLFSLSLAWFEFITHYRQVAFVGYFQHSMDTTRSICV